ncbi:Gfo/Idh/MocA family oxidoreductase [Lacrimispora saccharolytica]|uniref:Oxidoreductase domain protein n=1 Tax=Lacrimispora saccharolytica (strain ATCC 35040 / DSM 2544 / NRCC 2533 / WM1) TaxID=610130 RepID=D9R5K6_LACSW|nr:Gfo/Idh/MocA family oxidoreductase [Lacrimispora saccharolytica]ADL05189.1 oxidoreductase domain protein [[Clostridium] saccharolyticum WM1]QRV20631.1 Gfo/Idh/MocA family oxidoreductase [Lacrimispora saccharolytica]
MKLGIVGSGMIVQEFLPMVHHLEQVEVTAICCTKRSEAAGKELANKYSIKYIFTEYQEFLNCGVDTVYVALPNHLHFQFGKEALEAGKHVIVEKPFTTTYKESLELSRLARERKLFLLEAVTTLYLPNYRKIKELLPAIGNIKIVQCNFSQYSRRYDSFKEGRILPAFDPQCSGGALMDINIYNIHYVAGLFGRPLKVEYFPNVERGIDTSGILVLDYGTFKCTCVGAKDCKAPIANNIQGDKGVIHQESPASICDSFEIIMNNNTKTYVNENKGDHRMLDEFLAFQDMICGNDLEACYRYLDHTLLVSEIQTIARRKGGIVFPADKEA